MDRIRRREFLTTMSRGALGAVSCSPFLNLACSPGRRAAGDRPNFVILFADDMGYGDWNRGGHPTIRTPNLNRMADEGMQLTQFYTANPVCSPSRSALLTGRNAIRTGVIQVFFPGNGRGMALEEITLAEALKPLGYTSACIGKWHLGSTHEYRPLRQGFDYYYGILYSNDMYNPDLFRNDERIEHPTDQTTLTKRYTEEAVKFIERSKDGPFLLYVPYTMPHVPIFASEAFLGKSHRGLYGDVIEEIDWSVGRINQTLNRLGLDENTLVMFTSDNGPWWVKNERGGHKGLLRGAKGDTWEGGMREPFVARWPGRIPAGTISMEVGSVCDFFPTCVKLAGGEMPDDRPFDGIDLMPVLAGGESPERTIFFYRGEHLCAVRKGPWKLHFHIYDPTGSSYSNRWKNWISLDKPQLYNLDIDPSERFDIAEKHPEVADELAGIAERYEAEIRESGENKDLIDWFINDWPTAPRRGE